MQKKTLIELKINQRAKIVNIQGGAGFYRKLSVMGIREGQIIKIISKQPFRGPITFQIRNSSITIGRGMAYKIYVEEI